MSRAESREHYLGRFKNVKGVSPFDIFQQHISLFIPSGSPDQLLSYTKKIYPEHLFASGESVLLRMGRTQVRICNARDDLFQFSYGAGHRK
jgi:hypothetical protein